MNKAQKKQFELLKELDRICKKNNIKYFLCGGTLLGAVRHKGFIPWDDDVDIEMLREDFEKFKKVCKKDLNKKYFYQDIETDKYYGNLFAKLRINNTKYVERITKNTKAHNGIYLDIFPIDNYDDIDKPNIKKVIILRMLLLLKNKYIIDANTFVKKIELLCLKIMSLFFTKKCIINKINKLVRNNTNKDSEKVIDYFDVLFDRLVYQRKWYTKQKEYEFEGRKFTGTYYYDEYLTHLYGDYMKIPPKEDRVTHDIVEIEYDE